MRTRDAVREAKRRGHKHGTNAASWQFDGNTSDETILYVYDALQSGDDTGIQEPGWLSGEWAGESIAELLGDVLEQVRDDVHDDVETAYETAASEAFWHAIERRVSAKLAPDDGRTFDGWFTSPAFSGVAVSVVGRNRITGDVVVVMVGDDARHTVDPDTLKPVTEEEFCAGCGQLGCGH